MVCRQFAHSVVNAFTALHSDSRSSCVTFVSSLIANYDNVDPRGRLAPTATAKTLSTIEIIGRGHGQRPAWLDVPLLAHAGRLRDAAPLSGRLGRRTTVCSPVVEKLATYDRHPSELRRAVKTDRAGRELAAPPSRRIETAPCAAPSARAVNLRLRERRVDVAVVEDSLELTVVRSSRSPG
jgi:hypothetical protein